PRGVISGSRGRRDLRRSQLRQPAVVGRRGSIPPIGDNARPANTTAGGRDGAHSEARSVPNEDPVHPVPPPLKVALPREQGKRAGPRVENSRPRPRTRGTARRSVHEPGAASSAAEFSAEIC